MRKGNETARLWTLGRPAVVIAGMVIIGLAGPASGGDADGGYPVPIHVFDMNTDPGWSTAGMWEHGQPTGQGGTQFGYPDPTSGATGVNVYGYNLYGDYPIDIGGPYWLTTTALDCTGYEQVTLQFERWLNTDWQPWVRASIEVSNDGLYWMQVWENDAGEIVADSWTTYTYDISAIADGQAAVYVRWGHEVLTDGTWAYSGWNIDDVMILGVEASASCPADFDGDSDVDTADLLFLLGAWGTPGGDVDDDGDTDTADLLALLGAWGGCP